MDMRVFGVYLSVTSMKARFSRGLRRIRQPICIEIHNEIKFRVQHLFSPSESINLIYFPSALIFPT